MALFPSSPTDGQEATVNGILYTYSGAQTAWVRIGVSTTGDLSVTGNLTVSGDADFNSSITEKVFTITDGASVVLDPVNGTVQLWTLGASRAPTANFVEGQSITLMVDDGSAYTITWPSVTWKTDGGSSPTLNTSGYTAIVLWKVGSVLYGARVGNA